MNGLAGSFVLMVAAALPAVVPGIVASAEPPAGVVASFQTPDESGLTEVLASSSERILLGSARGGIWEWNPATNAVTELRPASKPVEPIVQLRQGQSGRLLVGSEQQWLIRSGEGGFEKLTVPKLTQMAASPTGRQIAGIAVDPPILFIDPASGEKTHRVDRQVWVDEMQYSPSGEFLATSRYSRLYLWNTGTGDLVWKSRLEDNIRGFAFSPDQSTIFSSMAKEGLWVTDAATGNLLKRYSRMHNHGNKDSPHRLAFSPDGQLLADSPATNLIEIWETFTGRAVLLLGKHPGEITALHFLPEGTRLVSADNLGQAYVWDLSAPEFAAPFEVDKPYTEKELARLWRMLGEPRGHAAWSALVALKHRPRQALDLIDNPPKDDLLIQQLIQRLDDDEFTVRQAAYRALSQLSLNAEPFLKKTLSTSRSAEVKVRIRRLLASLAGPHREAQRQLLKESKHHHQMRIVQLLKWMGSTEAKDRLQTLRDSTEIPAIREQSAAALRWLEPESETQN
jgi:hypothetical protein